MALGSGGTRQATTSTPASTKPPQRGLLRGMKILVALVLFLGLVAPAAANDYLLEHRPEVTFRDGPAHMTPYPQSGRSATVWNRTACWNDCSTDCKARMTGCMTSASPDACRPHLDACDRSCQRSCRSFWQGPLAGFLDF